MAESIRADAPALGAILDSEVNEWMPAYQGAIRHELRLGHALEALRLADRAKARVLLDMIGRGQTAFDAAADPADRAEAQKIGESVASVRREAIVHPQPAAQSALEAALRRQDDFNLRFYGLHPELALERAAPPDIQPAQLASLATGRTALFSPAPHPRPPASFLLGLVHPAGRQPVGRTIVFRGLPTGGRGVGRRRKTTVRPTRRREIPPAWYRPNPWG